MGATAPLPDNDTYGTSVTFTCAADSWFHRDVYKHHVTCESDGTWQPEPPGDCTRKTQNAMVDSGWPQTLCL